MVFEGVQTPIFSQISLYEGDSLAQLVEAVSGSALDLRNKSEDAAQEKGSGEMRLCSPLGDGEAPSAKEKRFSVEPETCWQQP